MWAVYAYVYCPHFLRHSKQRQLIGFGNPVQNTVFFQQFYQGTPQRGTFLEFFKCLKFSVFSSVHNALRCIYTKPLQGIKRRYQPIRCYDELFCIRPIQVDRQELKSSRVEFYDDFQNSQLIFVLRRSFLPFCMDFLYCLFQNQLSRGILCDIFHCARV